MLGGGVLKGFALTGRKSKSNSDIVENAPIYLRGCFLGEQDDDDMGHSS